MRRPHVRLGFICFGSRPARPAAFSHAAMAAGGRHAAKICKSSGRSSKKAQSKVRGRGTQQQQQESVRRPEGWRHHGVHGDPCIQPAHWFSSTRAYLLIVDKNEAHGETQGFAGPRGAGETVPFSPLLCCSQSRRISADTVTTFIEQGLRPSVHCPDRTWSFERLQ